MPLRRIEPSYFNPRSSCEERPAREKPSRRQGRISIHAPHARSDPPCRIRCAMSSAKISIHAPHARSDYYTTYTAQKSRNFNPRSSCEERLALNAAADAKAYISIHAPHARSDFILITLYHVVIDFNPRSSCEERLFRSHRTTMITTFQSTLLMRGATCGKTFVAEKPNQFQSTLLMRGATIARCLNLLDIILFQSTLLMRGATLEVAPDGVRHHISIHAPHARSDSSILQYCLT